jgi:hypothetical protein
MRVLTAVGVVTLLVVTALPIQGQASDFEPPRLANGKPDFNGIWQALNTANWNIERHMAQAALVMREGPAGPVPAMQVLALGAIGSVPGGMGIIEGNDGKIPYNEAGLAKRQENLDDWMASDPEIRCYMPGVPRANYMPYPFQIIQNENSFFMAFEYAGAVRDIYLEDPGPAPVDSWMGWSHGTWDGDTFVVEVEGLLDQSWLDRAGNHHSDQMKVTERYTMVTENHINYEATIEDPVYLEKPYKISMPLYRRMEPDAQLMDFRCVEFVEELLYGEWRRNPLPRPEGPLANRK